MAAVKVSNYSFSLLFGCFSPAIPICTVAWLIVHLFHQQRTGNQSLALKNILLLFAHDKNLPMQFTEIFSCENIENFIGKNLIILIFLLTT